MHGFKSFAKRTEIVLEDKFNCVLGPNGSGKSNVLDALCFVLGKGSAKGLRAEKSSNLIYNGGKTKSPAKFGQVSIVFDNMDRDFPIESDEVTLSRIIKPSGQSIYKINEETKTRQQVLDILSAAKIDPDGYNIILQGDIVRIVEMSPTERRKVIEEIAGISVYEEKKQKALNELDKVEGKLKEAEILLSERKSHLQELKKERDQAKKFKDLRDKIDSNKASHLKIQIDKKEAEKQNYDKLEAEFKEAVKKSEEEINEFKRKNEELQGKIDEINKEVEQRGEKDQVELNKEVENLRVEIGTNEKRVQTINTELEKIKQRKEQFEGEKADLDKKIEDIKAQKKEYSELRKKKEEDLKYYEDKISEFKKKNNVEGVGEIEKQVEEIDKVLEEKQNDLQELREKQQNLLRDQDKIEFQMQTIDEKVAKVKEVEKENKKQLENLKNQRQQFKKITLDLNKRLNDDSTYAAKIGSHRSNLLEAQDKLARLQAKNNAAKEFRFGEESVKQILAQKDRIKGIHGMVSELGNVNSKYSMALEIAAGGKLKNIIVDSDSTASECIRFLKERKLGTASFIPLNKVKAPAIDSSMNKFKNINGVHDFAVNLVSYDSKLKKAFQHVFGNTLVVDSIDVARRIGIGTVRMVTLDGDLTEGSGVMRGGHREKKRRMGFKEQEMSSEIEKLEKDVSELQETLSSMESKRSANEQEIASLREQKANLEGEIIKLEKSLHIESGDMEASKEKKKELDEQLKGVNKEIKEVQQKITDANKFFAQKKVERQQLRTKISELRNPKLLAELSTFEEKKGNVKGEISEIDNKVNGLDMQLDTVLYKEKEKYEKISKQQDKEEMGFKQELEDLNKKIKEDKATLKDKEEKAKEFYNEFKSLFVERNKLADQMKNNESKVIAKNEKIKDLEIKLNNASVENAGVKAKIASLYEEFEQYKNVEIQTDKTESAIKKEIQDFEKMLENIGNVNMKALEIYESVEEEYQKMTEKKKTLDGEKKEIHKMMDEIETKKKEIFLNSFEELRKHFKKLFAELTTKGDAELVLENPRSPFEGGVTISVKITSKKYLDIRSLSGGEKSMTALAFIFAIQEHEPASFYILDEVDAALDKRNAEKLANLLRKYSENAQYIIISHNDAIISEADVLYGVSMNDNSTSKVVSLKV